MKKLKSLTVLSLVYSMLAMSGLPITAMAQSSSSSNSSKTYHYQKKQVDENGEEYTSSTFKGEGEGQMNMADYMAMATMLAMGVAASSLAKAKPITTDIMLAAGSGAAYIGAEIYSMIAYDNIDVDQQIEVKMKESGEVDHEQLKALEKQKQSYLNIENAANTKAMIQAAATVGFLGAAGVAAYKSMGSKHHIADCQLAGGTMITGASTAAAGCTPYCATYCAGTLVGAAACIATCEGYCKGQVAACNTDAVTIEGKAKAIIASRERIGPSCEHAGELQTEYGLLSGAIEKAQASCVNPEPTHPLNSALAAGLTQAKTCLAGVPDEVKEIVCASHLQILDFSSTSPLMQRELDQMPFGNDEILRDAIFETNPELERGLVAGVEPELKKVFRTSETLGVRPRIKITEANIDRYVTIRDFNRSLNGELASISLDDYEVLKTSFGPKNLNQNQFEVGAILSAALSAGVDLLLPRAHAAKGAQGVGVLFAVGGLVYGLVRSEKLIMDKFMSTPGHRALVWGGIAAMATATSILSKKIAEKMGQNARKIDQMIGAMRRLDSAGSVNTLGGNGGETQQAISTAIVRPTKDIAVDPTGETKLPCVGGGKPPCKSISGNLDKTAGFVELKSSPLGTISTLTGNVADGVQGQSTLTAGTLNQAQDLANQKEAVGKRNKKLFDELNKLRLKNKQKPIDFDKESQRLARAFENAAKKQFKSNPSGARNLLASIAPAAPLGNLDEELSKEEVAAEEDGIKDENTAVAALQGNAKPEDNGFSFDFGDDNGNTVVDAGAGEAALPDVIEGETGNDIIDKPNVPIWTIISVRYMKSGFPRLLELKEE